MRLAIVVGAMLVLTGSVALAQDRSVEPTRPRVGMGSKSMDSCGADQRKYCAKAASTVTKECLVTNWDRITSECQDALGIPIGRTEDGGQRQGE